MLHLSQSYTHKHSSNILGTDGIESSSGYDIQLPVKLYRQDLGYPERLTRVSQAKPSFPVRNCPNGLEMISGLLGVTGKEGDFYDCEIGQGAYEFSAMIKDKTLKDLDLGGERTFVKQSHYNYPDEDFTLFPVGNFEFWKDEEIKKRWISEVSASQNFFADDNLPYTLSLTGFLFTPFVITPFPFVGYLLKQIFKFAKMNITRNDWDSTPMLARKVMYLNESICKTSWYNPSGHWGWNVRSFDKWSMNDIIQDIKIKDFLIWLQNSLNVCFDFGRNREVRIIDREAIFSKPASRFFLDKIIPNSTFPDLEEEHNGISFIQDIDTSDTNFSETYWQNMADVDPELIDPPVEFRDDLPEPGAAGHIRYCEETNNWYQWKEYNLVDEDGEETANTSWAWRFFSKNIQDLNLGEADFLEIKSGFSPTNVRPGVAGNEDRIETRTSMKPRLFNHYGDATKPHSLGDSYASPDYDSVGDNFIGKDGLYQKRWANTARFYMNRTPVTCTATLTPRELRDLDDSIPYLHPDGYTFLIDKATAKVEEGDEILETELEIWAY